MVIIYKKNNKMILQIKINQKIYKSNIHNYSSLHRAIVNIFPQYTPKDYTIYLNNKVCTHTILVNELNCKEVIEIMPKLRGGASTSAMSSGLFYFILFF